VNKQRKQTTQTRTLKLPFYFSRYVNIGVDKLGLSTLLSM